MATTILQAAVGAGKTEAALERLTQVICDVDRPLTKAWVLLATKRQEVAFRQRLIELQDGRRVYFNAEFFNFYELNARLLNLHGDPQRKINQPARLGLLRKIILELASTQQLGLFASIAGTAGFVRVIADLIDDLKQNRVQPDDYLAAATTPKDRVLATIYSRYQDLLIQHRLVDTEGEGWRALEAAAENPQLARDVALLLVDGYDQFTLTQASLLAQLSTRIPDVLITLTKPPGHDEHDPQRSIGRRFVEAANRLHEVHSAIGATIHSQDLTRPIVEKQPDLLTLGRNIFSNREPAPATGGIHLLEAPDITQEVGAVLRDVKRRLLEGARPDDVLIALRDWPRYHTAFEIYQRLYELPLMLHYGTPMSRSPVITTVMNLLSLTGANPDSLTSFRRRQLLDVLRSPYLQVPGLDEEAVDLLDRISREKQILSGRQNWLDAIENAGEPTYDEDGEKHDPIIQADDALQIAMRLHTDLDTFFKKITPPEQAGLLDYVLWLEQLIGDDPLKNPDDAPEENLPQPHEIYTLNIPACIRAIQDVPQSDALINRDTVALNQFKDLLGGMLATQEFLRAALNDPSPVMHWHEFFMDLQNGVRHERATNRNPIRSGRVLVTTATQARGLPHQHVYILGLSEGIFPAEVREDPLYLRSEIERLREAGVSLQTPAERSDDNGIFYELISLPRASLTLSRPTVQEGKPWVESHLWRMTRAVFDGLQPRRMKIGQVVPVPEVAALDEAVLAVADGFNQDEMQTHPDLHRLYSWLMHHAEHKHHWQHIEQGRAVEASRLSREPHNRYTGQLQNEDLIEHIASEHINEQRIWSASQMGEYGICGYYFFAKRLLKLQALDEPQEGLDALQLGALNHAVLEQTYREIGECGLFIKPDNRDEALGILQDVAAERLPKAPQTYHFRESALWEQEQEVIKRRLQLLVEMDFSADAPLNHFGKQRRPFGQEYAFGLKNQPIVEIPIAGGTTLKVRGSIDRVDLVDEKKLVIVDYKTGTSAISNLDMKEGRHFQMMVYLLAMDAILKRDGLPYEIAGGAFWHIRNLKLSGKVSNAVSLMEVEEIHNGQHYIMEYIAAAQQGDFRVQPAKPDEREGKCTRYCEYYQLCRLSRTHQNKHKDRSEWYG